MATATDAVAGGNLTQSKQPVPEPVVRGIEKRYHRGV
jgi:hypothetical protein